MVVGLITITMPRSILTRILALISEGFMVLLFIENLMWANEGLEGYLGFGFWVSASRNGVLAKPSLTVRELFHVVGVYF